MRIRPSFLTLAPAVCLAAALSLNPSATRAQAAPEVNFVYAAVGVPGSLDIWTKYEGDATWNLSYEIGSVLVEYDVSKLAENGCSQLGKLSDLRPSLATSWRYSDDGKRLLFTLREGVKSAAGNTMTAEDVVWSLDFAKKQSATVRYLISNAGDFDKERPFEVVDEKTVAINLNKKTAVDVALFTIPLLGVIDTKEVKKHATAADPMGLEWLKTNLANFGPWKLEKYVPSSEVLFSANPNFWAAGQRGNINRLTIRAIPESATRFQLLQVGQADYAERLSFDEYARLKGSRTAKLVNCVSPNRERLIFNQKFGPFAKPEVRQALSLAIDREALMKGVYKELFSPSTIGLSDVYVDAAQNPKKLGYDPDKARKMLADAGVGQISFTITATPSKPGPWAQSLAVQMAEMIKKVGVDAKIRVIPGTAEADDTYRKGNYEAFINVEIPAIADAFYSLSLYNGSWSHLNSFSYKSDAYDRVTRQLQVTPVGAEREVLLRQASDIIVDETPAIYVAEQRYLRGFSQAVQGYENSPHGQLLTYRMSKSR